MRQWNRPGNTVCIRWRTHYPGRFRGTYYRAANWKLFGRTTGRGKGGHQSYGELSASLRRAVPCRNRLGYFSEK